MIPVASYACDRDGIIIHYNQKAAELWGHAPKLRDPAQLFCGSLRMYHPDGSPLRHSECPMANALRNGAPVRDEEIVIERPDGARIIALVNVDAFRNGAGEIVGAINCFRPIDNTQSKETVDDKMVVATFERQVGERTKTHGAKPNIVDGGTMFEEQQSRYFHELLQSMPAAVYITDADGRITFYNEAAATLWGCRPELGKSEFCGSWKLYWPDGTPLPHDECPVALALKEKQPNRGMEAVGERPDGTRVPFMPYPSPMFDAAGNLIGAVNMLVDLTEIKRGDEASARLAAIVESSHDAIVSKNLEGIIASWNRGAERLFGYTANEAIGKPITMLIPPDRSDEEPAILERIRRGVRVETYETIRRHKDGSLVNIALTVSPVRDATGRIIGASKVARDITDRKTVEKALRQSHAELRESEERYRALFSHAPIAVFVCDRNAVVQDYNEHAAELWGREPQRRVEKHCGSVRLWLPDGTPLPHEQTPLGEVLRTGIPALGIEVLIERPDASRIPVLVNFAPLRSGQGEIVGAITSFIDIADRKRTEEQRELLLREMNHRIKNLFTLASSMVSLSRRGHVSADDLVGVLRGRLEALAQAHQLTMPELSEQDQKAEQATTLGALLQTIVAPYLVPEDGDERIATTGPEVSIGGRAATSLALVLHELATNAAKYGALSCPEGRVTIGWSAENGALLLTWREQGGPALDGAPDKEGFGSSLARQLVTGQLGGDISHHWNPEGLTVHLTISVERMGQ